MSIWLRNEEPGYNKSKADVGYSRWRVLIMDRTMELAEISQDEAVNRIHGKGQRELGLAYEAGQTAEFVAGRLA